MADTIDEFENLFFRKLRKGESFTIMHTLAPPFFDISPYMSSSIQDTHVLINKKITTDMSQSERDKIIRNTLHLVVNSDIKDNPVCFLNEMDYKYQKNRRSFNVKVLKLTSLAKRTVCTTNINKNVVIAKTHNGEVGENKVSPSIAYWHTFYNMLTDKKLVFVPSDYADLFNAYTQFETDYKDTVHKNWSFLIRVAAMCGYINVEINDRSYPILLEEVFDFFRSAAFVGNECQVLDDFHKIGLEKFHHAPIAENIIRAFDLKAQENVELFRKVYEATVNKFFERFPMLFLVFRRDSALISSYIKEKSAKD